MSKGLGKGLSALIAEKPVKNKQVNITATNQSNITTLPIEDLVPGQFQPRGFFDENELHDLANSIKKNGVFQPVLVRKYDDKYEIIAGERRWRASKIAGQSDIPVIIRELENKEALEIAIIENVQRQDLIVLEVAEGYKRLIQEFAYTQEELSDVIGKSRSAITNTLRLLTLPSNVKELVNENKISAGHARALLSAQKPIDVAELVVKKGLNVRQTEALVKKLNSGKVTKKSIRDPEITSLEQEVAKKIGYKVSITNSGDAGKITLEYTSLEELDAILRKLGG